MFWLVYVRVIAFPFKTKLLGSVLNKTVPRLSIPRFISFANLLDTREMTWKWMSGLKAYDILEGSCETRGPIGEELNVSPVFKSFF